MFEGCIIHNAVFLPFLLLNCAGSGAVRGNFPTMAYVRIAAFRSPRPSLVTMSPDAIRRIAGLHCPYLGLP